MTYSIFQLKREHPNAFMNLRWAQKHGGVNFSDYETVYTGEIEPRATVDETLEALYVLFNTNHPADYRGRSMSVSDLVALEDTGTYFCDSIGFKQLN